MINVLRSPIRVTFVCLSVTEVCSGGNSPGSDRGSQANPTMVPNFLGQLNLTPQYPTLPSDIARNWRWTFGPSLSDRQPSTLGFPRLGLPPGSNGCSHGLPNGPQGQCGCYKPTRCQLQRHLSSSHSQTSPSQKLGLQTPPQSPGQPFAVYQHRLCELQTRRRAAAG